MQLLIVVLQRKNPTMLQGALCLGLLGNEAQRPGLIRMPLVLLSDVRSGSRTTLKKLFDVPYDGILVLSSLPLCFHICVPISPKPHFMYSLLYPITRTMC